MLGVCGFEEDKRELIKSLFKKNIDIETFLSKLLKIYRKLYYWI